MKADELLERYQAGEREFDDAFLANAYLENKRSYGGRLKFDADSTAC